MKDKKNKRWCSKHQVVHLKCTRYWSCRFPNDKELNKRMIEWRKNRNRPKWSAIIAGRTFMIEKMPGRDWRITGGRTSGESDHLFNNQVYRSVRMAQRACEIDAGVREFQIQDLNAIAFKHGLKIYKGEDYYYWIPTEDTDDGDLVYALESTMVLIADFDQMSRSDWVEELNEMIRKVAKARHQASRKTQQVIAQEVKERILNQEENPDA